MNKRLVKGKDRKIAGVCSGFADYFDCDPTIMRLIFIGTFLFFGVGLLFYLGAAIIMPNE